jgi:hypothetical protein
MPAGKLLIGFFDSQTDLKMKKKMMIKRMARNNDTIAVNFSYTLHPLHTTGFHKHLFGP